MKTNYKLLKKIKIYSRNILTAGLISQGGDGKLAQAQQQQPGEAGSQRNTWRLT